MTAHRLWLVRHARPQIAPGLCYGMLDVPADPQATADCARRVAQALPPRLPAFHSPLQRCEQLALSLRGLRPDLAILPDPRLAEMDFGTWEGRAWNAIAREDIDAWTARFASHRPGGGDALADMLLRVATALDDARAAAARQRCDVLWISHAGVARCVQWLLGAAGRHGVMPRADQWPLAAPEPGHWDCYRLD